MTLKIYQILALQKLYTKISQQELPIRLNYKLTKFYKSIESDFEFYKTKMTEIINEYGQRDENGSIVLTSNGSEAKIQPDRAEECQSKINELMGIEATDVYNLSIKLDEIETLKLTMQEMKLLEPFIEEE